jgi:hypothetical protein
MSIFLVVAAVGMGLLVISLVLGEVFDGVADVLAGDWFSGAVLSAFVAAFGLGGALATSLGSGTGVAVAAGAVAGGLFGWLAAWLTKVVRRSESGHTPTTADAVGLDATIVSAIPADGFGVVTVRVAGHLLRCNARAEVALEPGTPVHVTSALSPSAVSVAPVWNSLDS